jgi:hypothetical protein
VVVGTRLVEHACALSHLLCGIGRHEFLLRAREGQWVGTWQEEASEGQPWSWLGRRGCWIPPWREVAGGEGRARLRGSGGLALALELLVRFVSPFSAMQVRNSQSLAAGSECARMAIEGKGEGRRASRISHLWMIYLNEEHSQHQASSGGQALIRAELEGVSLGHIGRGAPWDEGWGKRSEREE